MKLISY